MSSQTLHGAISIILISFSKRLFSKSYNRCLWNEGKRTKVLLLLLLLLSQQYVIQWVYWTCVRFRPKQRKEWNKTQLTTIPGKQWWCPGRTVVGMGSIWHPSQVYLLNSPAPASQNSDSSPYRDPSRLRRWERSFWKEAEASEGSIWTGACWGMPRGASLKGNEAARHRCRGRKRSSTRTGGTLRLYGVFPQDEPKYINTWVLQRNYLLGQFHINSE